MFGLRFACGCGVCVWLDCGFSVVMCLCTFVRLGSVGLLLFVWFVYFGIVVCLRTCAAVGVGWLLLRFDLLGFARLVVSLLFVCCVVGGLGLLSFG